MSSVLEVKNLTKRYPAFTLDGVSFAVGEGRVTGLIGANGAGKTTTLKAVTGLIRAEGEIKAFGHDFRTHEREIKQKIGYVGGGFRYYPLKSVGAVAHAASGCYAAWDQADFKRYLTRFSIDKNKKISQLSDGMKVKFYLALALSHGAKLLILDEPTSGLDPLSREDFCDTVLSLVREAGVSVLFSTHITSDLERIADDIVLLSHGKLIADEPLEALKSRYTLARFASEAQARAAGAVGAKAVKNGWEGLLARTESATPLNPPAEAGGEIAPPYLPSPACGGGVGEGESARLATLDEIMIHLEIEYGRSI